MLKILNRPKARAEEHRFQAGGAVWLTDQNAELHSLGRMNVVNMVTDFQRGLYFFWHTQTACSPAESFKNFSPQSHNQLSGHRV